MPAEAAGPEPVTDTLAALRRGALAGVRSLRLGPGLTEFPREVFGLADTLEQLDLSGNDLSALPDDLGRLHALRVLFCSGNRFSRLPPCLGDCPALSQVGFRACGLREVPGESLPPALRWLTLTDNRIAVLPQSIGERPALQKLMLAGNRLTAVPESLAAAANLELLRLSANRLEVLPPWLSRLPRLAWLAWSGNPLDRDFGRQDGPAIPWSNLRLGERLGDGASGWVHQAVWHLAGGETRAVAVKLFKHAMTSDGLPEREMAVCLAAGAHPNLTAALGRLGGHPAGLQGLVMPLLPTFWRPLAGPPSLESCSRDVYDSALRLDPPVALRLARSTGFAAAHLHRAGLMHGDLYAHNTLWDGAAGDAVLSDFGAASFMLPGGERTALGRIEVRAWGLLLGELLDRCPGAPQSWRALHDVCVQPACGDRPNLDEALEALS